MGINNRCIQTKENTDRDLSQSGCCYNAHHGVLHGASSPMATASADPYAVELLLLAGFTESRLLIGFVVSLITAMPAIPQITLCRQIRREPSSAWSLMLIGVWTRCAGGRRGTFSEPSTISGMAYPSKISWPCEGSWRISETSILH